MKNKMDDLRNHLFAQLERLGDETLTPEQIAKEIERAKAVSDVSQTLINSAKVEVDFIRAIGGERASPFLEESAPKLMGAPAKVRAIG